MKTSPAKLTREVLEHIDVLGQVNYSELSRHARLQLFRAVIKGVQIIDRPENESAFKDFAPGSPGWPCLISAAKQLSDERKASLKKTRRLKAGLYHSSRFVKREGTKYVDFVKGVEELACIRSKYSQIDLGKTAGPFVKKIVAALEFFFTEEWQDNPKVSRFFTGKEVTTGNGIVAWDKAMRWQKRDAIKRLFIDSWRQHRKKRKDAARDIED